MDLDRRRLAKIDRKVLAGLGHDERYWMVRVPVSDAVWSMWRRYCQAVGCRWVEASLDSSPTSSALWPIRIPTVGPYTQLRCSDDW
ncbi:MAG: hypothetical protein U9N84_05585 [Actinomycetota bacterium]|nr:hypothetical protein [Actinomycetota bacterium]